MREADLRSVAVLPERVAQKPTELDGALQRNVDEARYLLKDLFGEIVLRPSPEGLILS